MTFYMIRLASSYGPYFPECPEAESTDLAKIVWEYDCDDILGVYEVEKSGQALEDYSLVNVTDQAAKLIWDHCKDDLVETEPPQFVRDHYPEWKDEREEEKRHDYEMRSHLRRMSHRTRYL